VPLASRVEGANLVVHEADLARGARRFAVAA
jgi:hypothetical protein